MKLLKILNYGWMGLIIFFTSVPVVIAEEPQNSSQHLKLNAEARAKILQPSIIERLERGKETVNIIVLLKGYQDYVGKIKADKPGEMKALQVEIRRKQDIVLNRLNRAQFKLKHRFENILGFSGSADRSGLEALAAMPEVESIEEDREVEISLAQGIPLMNGSQVRSTYNGAGVSIAIVVSTVTTRRGSGIPTCKS